jgi:anti-sigma factor RsiW
VSCPDFQKFLHAHHDGELDAANTLRVDEHLAGCPACSEEMRRLGALRAAVRAPALRFTAPDELRRSLRLAVEQTARAETPVRRSWSQQLGWAAALALLFTMVGREHLASGGADDRLLTDLTENHVRSLMVDHLTDVTSTDQHTVKPWFDGKIDFAPPVKELRDVGFPLLGGRLDVVEGHTAAALVYGRQKHFLNLYIWPGNPAWTREVRASQRNGYHLLRWSDGSMNFSLVSDLNEAEMHQFVQSWSAK